MSTKTRGIIFHTIKYGETGLIVKIYTETSGLQSFIISNVTSKKTKMKGGIFEPMTLVELIFEPKENRSLQRIKEIRTSPTFHSISTDIVKSSLLLFMNEIVYKSIKEQGHPDQPLFDYIFTSLLILDLNPKPNPNFHLYFMVQLSRLFGFFPLGEYSELTPYFDLKEGKFIQSNIELLITMNENLSSDLYFLMNCDIDELENLKLNHSIRKSLMNKLLLYFELHLSTFKNMKTPDILEAIFS
ncbi:MAG: DNA repair protein RecO [Bacteroidota bacterium]